jgi:hypothetical protein
MEKARNMHRRFASHLRDAGKKDAPVNSFML